MEFCRSGKVGTLYLPFWDLTKINTHSSQHQPPSHKLNNARVGIIYFEVDLGVLKWVDVFLSGSGQSMNMS